MSMKNTQKTILAPSSDAIHLRRRITNRMPQAAFAETGNPENFQGLRDAFDMDRSPSAARVYAPEIARAIAGATEFKFRNELVDLFRTLVTRFYPDVQNYAGGHTGFVSEVRKNIVEGRPETLSRNAQIAITAMADAISEASGQIVPHNKFLAKEKKLQPIQQKVSRPDKMPTNTWQSLSVYSVMVQ